MGKTLQDPCSHEFTSEDRKDDENDFFSQLKHREERELETNSEENMSGMEAAYSSGFFGKDIGDVPVKDRRFGRVMVHSKLKMGKSGEGDFGPQESKGEEE